MLNKEKVKRKDTLKFKASKWADKVNGSYETQAAAERAWLAGYKAGKKELKQARIDAFVDGYNTVNEAWKEAIRREKCSDSREPFSAEKRSRKNEKEEKVTK